VTDKNKKRKRSQQVPRKITKMNQQQYKSNEKASIMRQLKGLNVQTDDLEHNADGRIGSDHRSSMDEPRMIRNDTNYVHDNNESEFNDDEHVHYPTSLFEGLYFTFDPEHYGEQDPQHYGENYHYNKLHNGDHRQNAAIVSIGKPKSFRAMAA